MRRTRWPSLDPSAGGRGGVGTVRGPRPRPRDRPRSWPRDAGRGSPDRPRPRRWRGEPRRTAAACSAAVHVGSQAPRLKPPGAARRAVRDTDAAGRERQGRRLRGARSGTRGAAPVRARSRGRRPRSVPGLRRTRVGAIGPEEACRAQVGLEALEGVLGVVDLEQVAPCCTLPSPRIRVRLARWRLEGDDDLPGPDSRAGS